MKHSWYTEFKNCTFSNTWGAIVINCDNCLTDQSWDMAMYLGYYGA